MNAPHKRSIILFSIVIIMVLAALACEFDTGGIFVGPNHYYSDEEIQQTENALNALKNEATITQEAFLETQSAALTSTKGAESLISGVLPQEVICEGNYTTTLTNLANPDETCTYAVPFTLVFYNVGAYGEGEYAAATFHWSYVDFEYDDCEINEMVDKTSTGVFSGGPNGLASVAWASIQLSSGLTGSLSFSDENEYASGTCTVLNPSAFSGWTGP